MPEHERERGRRVRIVRQHCALTQSNTLAAQKKNTHHTSSRRCSAQRIRECANALGHVHTCTRTHKTMALCICKSSALEICSTRVCTIHPISRFGLEFQATHAHTHIHTYMPLMIHVYYSTRYGVQNVHVTLAHIRTHKHTHTDQEV